MKASIRLVLGLAAAIKCVALGAGTGTLRVRIVTDGKLTPARAWVDDSAGTRHHTPTRPDTCTPYSRDRSFSCEGWFEIKIPSGAVVVHVEKGKEFVPLDRRIELEAGEDFELSLTLERWVDMPAQGFYSADLHVHLGHDNARVLRQLSLADDVHIVPAFTYWLRGTEPSWNSRWPDWEGGPVIRVDAHHFVTRTNLEIERISQTEVPGGVPGASFLFHLPKPVSTPRFGSRFPTDAELCLAAKTASPDCVIDTDKPSWPESVIGAALGVYDVAQVCHNHYHRLNTLPGGWGMIGPLAPDEKDIKEKDELFRRTNAQYYHWLNCGIRMGVSGGSAIGVMPVPLGYNRTYTQVEGELTPAKYWAAVKAGRTFATSGPMITIEVEERGMGSELAVSPRRPRNLEATAHLQTLEPIQSLELIENGRVIRSERVPPAPAGKSINQKFRWPVQPKRSGWYAARALFTAADGGLRQAHTSPVYIVVDGKPTAFKESAEYMLRWVDRLVEIARVPGRYQQEADKQQVIATYDRARKFYEGVSENAKTIWKE